MKPYATFAGPRGRLHSEMHDPSGYVLVAVGLDLLTKRIVEHHLVLGETHKIFALFVPAGGLLTTEWLWGFWWAHRDNTRGELSIAVAVVSRMWSWKATSRGRFGGGWDRGRERGQPWCSAWVSMR